MTQVSLKDVVKGVALKRLSAVEIDPNTSNQHELNGTSALRSLLGTPATRRHYSGSLLFLQDEEAAQLESENLTLTWYDSRENHPVRTEWRLYVDDLTGLSRAKPGDSLFIVLTHDEHLLLVIAGQGSLIESQLRWLFSFTDSSHAAYSLQVNDDLRHEKIGFVESFLLESLGIEIDNSNVDALALMLERFGEEFPKTDVFSEFAREFSGYDDIENNPDRALVEWIQTEEQLFKTFERHWLMPRIQSLNDVDVFLTLSLTVQNRRKSRAGRALESHLAAIFDAIGLQYEPGPITENRSRPDFLFPGGSQYHDQCFPLNQLYMLGAKSTLKDRWRQVLAEAQRITSKHLLTLDVAVSENQLIEMESNRLQLVIPSPLQVGYQPEQKKRIWNLDTFINVIRESQQWVS